MLPIRYLVPLGLLLLGALAVLADLLQPAAPVALLLTAAAAAELALALLAIGLWPRAAWPRALAWTAAPLLAAIGLLAGAQLAWDGGRGLLAPRLPEAAAWQERLFGAPPRLPLTVEQLRATLHGPAARPQPRPDTADEWLHNALLLQAQDDPAGAARALAETLRRDPDPRPDALLLHDALHAAGLSEDAPPAAGLPADAPPADAPPAPGPPDDTLPATLVPEARDHLLAMRIADPRRRAAALAAVLDAQPDALHSAAALAQALVAASLPQGPTIATAGRIAAVVEAFADPDRFLPYAERFLHPAGAFRLRGAVAALAWTREVAARRLSVTVNAPPPGLADAPILLRLAAPEPATAFQHFDGAAWAAVTPLPGEQEPTLRMPRPFQPRVLRLRYLDREGTAAPELAFAFDPVAALRDQAQRVLRRQGVFAFYLPGRLGENRLNALPLPGHLRAGLSAIEWATDAQRAPRSVPVGVPDDQVLSGDAPRVQVDFEVPPAAQLLLLTAVYVDGERSATVELVIR